MLFGGHQKDEEEERAIRADENSAEQGLTLEEKAAKAKLRKARKQKLSSPPGLHPLGVAVSFSGPTVKESYVDATDGEVPEKWGKKAALPQMSKPSSMFMVKLEQPEPLQFVIAHAWPFPGLRWFNRVPALDELPRHQPASPDCYGCS